MKLCVAVPTFRRPELLSAAIPVILTHVREAVQADPQLRAEVLVVDNCPEGSAATTVQALINTVKDAGAHEGIELRYVNERIPGISAARNRSLDESQDAEVLVFIDDDESPQDHWLAPLLETWQNTGAAAVMGRVESLFQYPPDSWVEAGTFFWRPRMATGTPLTVAATGNLLLDLHQIRHYGVRFSEHLGMTGGEDSLFSRELVRAGGSIVWCDESVATDYVPRERVQRGWLLKRAWSHGNAATLVELHLARTATAKILVRLKAVVSGAGRVVAGLLRHVAGRLGRSLRHQARGLRTLYRGAGMLAGGLGHVYVEYARTETAPSPEIG